MLTRPRSVAGAIEMATELFSDGSSVRVVTDKSTEKKEARIESEISQRKA